MKINREYFANKWNWYFGKNYKKADEEACWMLLQHVISDMSPMYIEHAVSHIASQVIGGTQNIQEFKDEVRATIVRVIEPRGNPDPKIKPVTFTEVADAWMKYKYNPQLDMIGATNLFNQIIEQRNNPKPVDPRIEIVRKALTESGDMNAIAVSLLEQLDKLK